MASKEKLLDSAQKFIGKGQIAKAIGEYQKLVDAFPKDFRYRQKIAELLTRERRHNEAQPHYEAVAKNFTETGFYLKAIAIYKQMQKVEPDRADLYLRLAELNEKQGLVGNALTEYRSLIACYEKNKQMRDALPVLQKMVELDPENLGVRGKLIETLISCHEEETASEQFRNLVAFLEGKGEHGKVVKLYEKFQTLCGDTAAEQLPLARALVASGQAGKALPVLKGLLKQNPEDAEVLGALIDCHLALDNHEDARLTCQHLLKSYPDNLLLRERHVRICLTAGDQARALASLEEARAAFSREGQNALFRELYDAVQGGRSDAAVWEEPASGSVNPLTEEPSLLQQEPPAESAAPEEPPAPAAVESPSAPPPKTQSPISASPRGLELELDLDLDLHRPAPAATVPATQAPVVPEPVALSPEKPVVAAAQPQVGQESELELELELDLGDLDVETAPPLLTDEAGESTGVTMDVELEDVSLAAGAGPAQEAFDELELELELPAEFPAQPVDSLPEAGPGADAELELELELPVEPFTEETGERSALELDLPDLGDFEPEMEIVEEVSGADLAAEPELELELEPELSAETEPEAETEAELLPELEAELELELPSTAASEEEPSALDEATSKDVPTEVEPEGALPDVEPSTTVEELPQVEELEELEELEEVLEELEELEELVELEDIDALAIEEFADADVEPSGVSAFSEMPDGLGEELAEEVAAVVAPPVDESGSVFPVLLSEGLEDAEFYLRQGLLDDAERVLGELQNDFAGHPEVLDKLAELAAQRQAPAEAGEPPALFDGFADIKEDELFGGVDAAEAVEQVIDEFSLESSVEEVEGEEDLQSHFDLGIAYKEMGLLDDAVVEFDRASRDPARRLDCLTLKGQCQLEMGQPAAAEGTYRQALDIPMLSDEGRQVLCYELGLLYEILGRKQEALDNYQIVANIDLFFRDVTDKLRKLRQELGVDDQAIEEVSEGGSGRDRISFV